MNCPVLPFPPNYSMSALRSAEPEAVGMRHFVYKSDCECKLLVVGSSDRALCIGISKVALKATVQHYAWAGPIIHKRVVLSLELGPVLLAELIIEGQPISIGV